MSLDSIRKKPVCEHAHDIRAVQEYRQDVYVSCGTCPTMKDGPQSTCESWHVDVIDQLDRCTGLNVSEHCEICFGPQKFFLFFIVVHSDWLVIELASTHSRLRKMTTARRTIDQTPT